MGRAQRYYSMKVEGGERDVDYPNPNIFLFIGYIFPDLCHFTNSSCDHDSRGGNVGILSQSVAEKISGYRFPARVINSISILVLATFWADVPNRKTFCSKTRTLFWFSKTWVVARFQVGILSRIIRYLVLLIGKPYRREKG